MPVCKILIQLLAPLFHLVVICMVSRGERVGVVIAKTHPGSNATCVAVLDQKLQLFRPNPSECGTSGHPFWNGQTYASLQVGSRVSCLTTGMSVAVIR